MTKLKKIRYQIAFAILDKVTQTIYDLRERHLMKLEQSLDRAAGYYYDKLNDDIVKVDLDKIDWSCCPDYAKQVGRLPMEGKTK